jgi:hypothetical protein
VAAGAGIGQIDRDLGVLDPPGGAGVLALHPDGVGALLQITGLVNYQHRVGVAEMRGDIVAQIVAHTIGVPTGPVEQVLHTVRIPVPGVLGDAPAVLARQISQQPEHKPPRPTAGLDPGEPARHPTEQPVGLGFPPSRPYPMAHGRRLII